MCCRICSAGRTETSSSAKSTPASSSSDQFYQFLFDRAQSPREGALQLLGRDLCLVESLRLDQVADRFRLGQIDAAVEKCAHGEFAGFSQTRSAGQSQFHHVPQDYRRSVGGDFDDVVSCVRVWLGEVGDDYFSIFAEEAPGSTSSPNTALPGTSSCFRHSNGAVI